MFDSSANSQPGIGRIMASTMRMIYARTLLAPIMPQTDLTCTICREDPTVKDNELLTKLYHVCNLEKHICLFHNVAQKTFCFFQYGSHEQDTKGCCYLCYINGITSIQSINWHSLQCHVHQRRQHQNDEHLQHPSWLRRPKKKHGILKVRVLYSSSNVDLQSIKALHLHFLDLLPLPTYLSDIPEGPHIPMGQHVPITNLPPFTNLPPLPLSMIQLPVF
ncbi:hypothetical protein M422DRAFT_50351 [Sphaerobolus stellatus SS14]|uniref:Uncharacterized protein n=1 Tax=Sphaerobolus stellatus (strain SS14) TaxID=990650 RepID=A0A0C9VJI9_SPHS4|nr:hypothetical protein M422DRAFT_50351 [Sphaerobolus stellatus SS14]